MVQRLSRRQVMQLGLLASLSPVAGGCGTVLHPERRGQPAGDLDWKIVALDAVGLLLFFIPGVIAFAVDFNNGTIYLPPKNYGKSQSGGQHDKLISRKLREDQRTSKGLEDVVSQHVNRPVRLSPGEYQTRPLQGIGEFWATHSELIAS